MDGTLSQYNFYSMVTTTPSMCVNASTVKRTVPKLPDNLTIHEDKNISVSLRKKLVDKIVSSRCLNRSDEPWLLAFVDT